MDTSTRPLMFKFESILHPIKGYSKDKMFFIAVVNFSHQQFADWEEMKGLSLVFVFTD